MTNQQTPLLAQNINANSFRFQFIQIFFGNQKYVNIFIHSLWVIHKKKVKSPESLQEVVQKERNFCTY